MAAFNLFKLSILFSILLNSHFGLCSETSNKQISKGLSSLPACSRIECPSYDVIHVGNDYEIRRYNSTVWASTSPIQDISLVEATRTGFLHFYVPKVNQANPPPAKGLQVQRWNPVYAAVRQFSGFVVDSDVGVEAAALQASLVDTVWSAAIEKSHGADHTSVYTVAQYNSPFEFDDRVNEIWMLFDMEDDFTE
ncbi:hypothetical protein CFP56_006694 [Quercus suber]|uniref:Heme-binding protein n=1 Tax=Quercus suber TaxID=58331 RepID=A0AAW0L9J6_QUESU